jgi:hypothetical protein
MYLSHALKNPLVEYANTDKAASIGNLNDGFLKSIYLAAQGRQLPLLVMNRVYHSRWRRKMLKSLPLVKSGLLTGPTAPQEMMA